MKEGHVLRLIHWNQGTHYKHRILSSTRSLICKTSTNPSSRVPKILFRDDFFLLVLTDDLRNTRMMSNALANMNLMLAWMIEVIANVSTDWCEFATRSSSKTNVPGWNRRMTVLPPWKLARDQSQYTELKVSEFICSTDFLPTLGCNNRTTHHHRPNTHNHDTSKYFGVNRYNNPYVFPINIQSTSALILGKYYEDRIAIGLTV